MEPLEDTPFLLWSAQFLYPPLTIPKGSAFWNADQPELGFQQLGLIPFTLKAGHAPPPNSAPSSCGPE